MGNLDDFKLIAELFAETLKDQFILKIFSKRTFTLTNYLTLVFDSNIFQ